LLCFRKRNTLKLAYQGCRGAEQLCRFSLLGVTPVFDSLNRAFFFGGLFLETVIIGLLFYRHVWRTLPVFCSYCVWDVASNAALMGISHFSSTLTFQAYFVDEILDSALIFAVLVELAWSVLRPIRSSLSRSSLVIVALLILVAGVAIWPFAALQGIAQAREALLYFQLQQTTSILRILFFLVLAGGSQLLSIGWRDRELQVATGLGLYSIVALTVAVIQTHQATLAQHEQLAFAASAGFLCCLAYWAFSFAQQEAARREFTPQMQTFLLAIAGAARSARVGFDEDQGRKPHDRSDR